MNKIEVENIKCGGCANSIEKELLLLDGVNNVTVNIEDSTVAIEGNANRLQLIQRLAGLGYPEKGNNSILSKAKSYLSCALGKIT